MSKPEVNLTFEQAISRLEEITSALDTGAISLDDSLALFSEGAGLIEFCNRSLSQAELTIQDLFPAQGGGKKPKVDSEC